MNMSPFVKRYLIITLSIMLGLVVLTSLWRYLNTGNIVITTGSPDSYITVSKAEVGEDGAKHKKSIKSANGDLSMRVPAGKYVIDVQNERATLTSKLIDVKPRKTFRYNLAFPKLGSTEPVIAAEVQDLSVNSTTLQYLDATSAQLTRVTSQNPIPTVISEQTFSKIQWADMDYGVGQTGDGQLYEIKSGSVSKLSMPRGSANTKRLSFSVAKDRRLYVSVNADIYTKSSSSPFKKIYKTSAESPILAGSPSKLAILRSAQYGDGTDQSSYVEIISSSGNVIAKNSVNADQAIWSSDGRKLAVLSYSDNSYIYDDALLELAQLPSTSIKTAAWQSEDLLLYGSGKTLWSYSLNENQSLALADISSGDITEVALNSDNSYAYLSSQADEMSGISRFGLKKQKIGDSFKQLDVFLPLEQLSCFATYSNFVKPTIIMNPFSDALAANCQTTVTSTLRDYGLDTAKFDFVFGPVLPQTD